uniref:Uncharacterized protein n=1 Tax=Arundo donax TaxID=35708 RepID=A0A0A9GM05_ARUDO
MIQYLQTDVVTLS